MNCVHGRPEGAICPHCCGNAWSNGSKTPPTDGTNSSPDRHAIIPITEADREAAHALMGALGMGRNLCELWSNPPSRAAPGGHVDRCDLIAQHFANHAASARAEEREACARDLRQRAVEASRVGSHISSGALYEAADAISRRSP